MLASQPKKVDQLIIDNLHDLAVVAQPALPGSRPGLTVGLRLTDHLHPEPFPPTEMVLWPCKPLIRQIVALRWLSDAAKPWIGVSPQGQKHFSQGLFLGRAGPKGETSDGTSGGSRDQQTKSVEPPQADTPTDVRLAGQPTSSPRLTLRTGTPVVSSCFTRHKKKFVIISCCARIRRLSWGRVGKLGNAARRYCAFCR